MVLAELIFFIVHYQLRTFPSQGDVLIVPQQGLSNLCLFDGPFRQSDAEDWGVHLMRLL